MDLVPWLYWNQKELTSRQTGQHSRFTSDLGLSKAEVQRSLSNILNKDRPDHGCVHDLNRLKEREAVGILLMGLEVGNDPCSARPALILRGHSRVMRHRKYAPL